MSDLDADLYADLYGNDETDFTGDVQETVKTEDTSAQESALVDPEPPAAAKPTQVTSATSSTPQSSNTATPNHTAQPRAQAVPASAPTPAASTPVPSYSAPPAQQIPTYEQPTTSDYRDQQVARSESGGFQNIPVPERTIRPSEMKDEGKMFIGGLNWDTTDDSLRNYFSQFGKVDACTIMRDAAGRSRCFAFLTFEDPASVNAVMVREHFLDGKIIDPKRAIPRQEHQRATKLFIGGLAGSVTSESMREFFSQYGKVIDSTVMLDRETGRSKGFGFVSFEDTNVQPFLGFGNLEIDGKLIDVKLAQPRYQRDNFGEQEGGPEFTTGAGRGSSGFTGGQNAYAATTAPAMTQAGNTPFDPQALAALYTRMFQITNAGQMNPAMMGAMGGGMGAGMGVGMGMMGNAGFGAGMGRGMHGGGMGDMSGMGMGMGGPGMSGGMARGGPGMMPGMNPNIPRGPRGGPGGPGGMGPPGVGPQRAGQRGQHNYHPYAR